MTNKTFHIWVNQLNISLKNRIHLVKTKIESQISESNFFNQTNHQLVFLNEMDEFYQSSPTSNIGSDKVFITPHLDGFLGWIPFLRVWRCIYGLNGPHETVTKIPFLIADDISISKNEFYCFDYNRDLHWVYQNNSQSNLMSRSILKLHFFDYPDWLSGISSYFGQLNIIYNQFARKQFLFSQDPYANPYTYLVSTFINFITILGGSLERYIGFFNMGISLILLYNNETTSTLLCLQNFFLITCISCKVVNSVPELTIRDSRSYILFIIGYLLKSNKKKINIRYYLRQSYFSLGVIMCLYCLLPSLDKKTYYQELSKFEETHQNFSNQLVHLITTSIGIMGVIELIHQKIKISYINLMAFMYLYTRYYIPDEDSQNFTLLLLISFMVFLKKSPSQFKKPITIILASIIFQEFSHYIFNESTYLSQYIDKSNSRDTFLRHIIWLLPFEIRILLNQYSQIC